MTLIKRVAIFSFDYPPHNGGISRLCAAIAREVARYSTDPLVISEIARDQAGPPSPRLQEIRVSLRRPWRELAAWWQLVRLPNDCLVVNGIWYPEGLIAFLAGRRPLIVLAHGLELRPDTTKMRRWIRGVLRRIVFSSARLVVANSEYTRLLVLAGAPAANVIAIPLGVDHLQFTPADRAAARVKFGHKDEFVIGTISRLEAYKGHDVVLNAIAALPAAARSRVKYVVGGVGSNLGAIRIKAQDLGLERQVSFLGFVSEGQLPDVYRAMDLFVMCTQESSDSPEVEGFGLAFLEAQACGTPVVGARTGGIPDAVKQGEGGWLISQHDSVALRDLILNLINDPDAVGRAGRAARNRIERDCTWDEYGRLLLGALHLNGVNIN